MARFAWSAIVKRLGEIEPFLGVSTGVLHGGKGQVTSTGSFFKDVGEVRLLQPDLAYIEKQGELHRPELTGTARFTIAEAIVLKQRTLANCSNSVQFWQES